MKKKHTYSTVSVDQVDLAVLLPLLALGCVIAIDVAKEKFVAAFSTLTGEILKLVRFSHPTETLAFLELVTRLQGQSHERKVVAALEPTGTYGDALRHQLAERGVPVYLVSPKATHDSRELFDGVPSLHDGKSAMIIAKLYALQRASLWPQMSAERRALRALVDQRALYDAPMQAAFGRIEAMLARHWPEFGCWMDVYHQKSALALLAEYGSPAQIVACEQQARDCLRRASRGRLSKELTDGVVASATTLGLPMTREEQQLMQVAAASVLEQQARSDEVERQMEALLDGDPATKHLAKFIGTYTAAALCTRADPLLYESAAAFEKGCGLNLREKSSGEKKVGDEAPLNDACETSGADGTVSMVVVVSSVSGCCGDCGDSGLDVSAVVSSVGDETPVR